MDNLDFSELTNDQLLGLLRALLRECVNRGAAVESAARAAGLDEQEKVQIASAAASAEAARLRALERERVAKEAAEKVRQAHEAVEAEATKHRSVEAGREAAARAWQQTQAERQWLSRAAELVGRKPEEISLLYLDTHYGWRVLINEGSDRYARDHLADWHAGATKIETRRELVKKKNQLIAFCAEFREAHRAGGGRVILGSELISDFSGEDEACPTN